MLAVLLLSAFVAAAWLLGTTAGARWLIAKIPAASSIRIQAGSIAGSICGGLHLRDLSLSGYWGSATAGEFNFRWQPITIFAGRISVRELSAADVRVRDLRPEAESPGPPELAWPRISGLLSYLTVDIAKADVERLSYRRLDKPPVAIDRVSARITVARGTADVRKIVFAVPQARVEGSAAIGLTGPYLRTNMNVFPAASPGGMDRIEVRMKLGRGGKDAVAEGSMTVTALAKGSKQIEMESDLGLFRKSIVLNKLQIKRPGKKGTVAGTIGIELSRDGPLLRAALGLRGLDLSREGLPFANMNGALRIDGKLEAYKGRLSLSNEGASWRGARSPRISRARQPASKRACFMRTGWEGL